ncbi:glycosyltransferase [Lysobacter koreensis]|uniref:Glycosyltransferase n=1 Tax=Lysobacter koreensis TaxID=266122 RepID=A0ABW2YJ81_9GAMM
MMARRLLLVSDEMEVGGSQRQISYLLGGLDRARWQPELLFFRSESFLVHELRAQGIRVHHLPKRGRFDLGFVLRYAALLRQGRYDLVHAYSLTAELWTAVARWLVANAPRQVSSVRNLYLDKSPLFWGLKRFALLRSAAVISNSRAAAAATAAEVKLPMERFDFVANGIASAQPLATLERAQLRQALGVPEGRTFGLFVGRLVEQKNLRCLVRALLALPAQDRPWIALAGHGPLDRELQHLCEAAGLREDMHFLGERSDAPRLMQAADFLVLPSFHEGMPNVVMEAMSVGCPVIASQVGGTPELVEHDATGLLFRSDDSDALAAQLRRLVAEPALRARLGRESAARIRSRYSIARLVDATVAVYERCLRADTHAAPESRQVTQPKLGGGA